MQNTFLYILAFFPECPGVFTHSPGIFPILNEIFWLGKWHVMTFLLVYIHLHLWKKLRKWLHNILAELRRPEGPSSGAPYSYGKEKETHQWVFLMVIMASGIARGRVRTTTTTTTATESCKMAAILQILGWQRHAALVYVYFADIGHACYDQWTPVKTRYLLTSITWPYRGLKCTAYRGHVFWSWHLTKCWFSIGSRVQDRSEAC